MEKLQIIIILVFAPLLQGFIKKSKALMQGRCGASIFQPYYDLFRLFKKDMVLSNVTSDIFKVTPYIVLASVITACLLVPVITVGNRFYFYGDIIAVVYVLAISRFFTALAGLDGGTSFGGEGSSREMTVAVLVEPTLMLTLFSVSIIAGSTNLCDIVAMETQFFTPAKLLAFAAFLIVVVAETGRIPVDNPDTHLELTMIHEGMILEYSGRYLAMIEYAHWIKQMLLFTIIIDVFFPAGMMKNDLSLYNLLISFLLYGVKVLGIGFSIAVIESSRAKMRFFQLSSLLGGSFILAFVSLLSYLMLGK